MRCAPGVFPHQAVAVECVDLGTEESSQFIVVGAASSCFLKKVVQRDPAFDDS